MMIGACSGLSNLEILILAQSLKSSNVELSESWDGRLFKRRLSVAANPLSQLDFDLPFYTACRLCIGQCVRWECTEPVVFTTLGTKCGRCQALYVIPFRSAGGKNTRIL